MVTKTAIYFNDIMNVDLLIIKFEHSINQFREFFIENGDRDNS